MPGRCGIGPVEIGFRQPDIGQPAASRPARILKTPAPNPLVLGFGESAIELQLRFWIADAHNGINNVKGEVLLEIWRLFRENGIPMPRPVRDVYLQSAEPPQASADEQKRASPSHQVRGRLSPA